MKMISQNSTLALSSLLWTILILIPVVITPYPPWDMYTIPKAIFLGCMLPVLVYYFIKTKPKLDIYYKTIGVFFVIHLLSTVFALDFKRAIFGASGWYEGFLVISCYCLIFILAKNSLFLDFKKIRIFLLLGLGIAVYSLFQLHGLDPLNDGYSYPLGTTLTTFGNRNSYGIYALIISCIFTSLYIFEGGKFYFGSACLAYLGLLASCTRGCWLGYAIACAILLTLNFRSRPIRNRCMKFCIAIFVLFATLNFSSAGKLMERYDKTITNLQEERSKLGSFRYIIWAESIAALSYAPLLGFGADSLDLGFAKYNKDGAYKIEKMSENFMDKAHNEYLQIACNAGILALLTYLSLLGMAYKNIWQRLKNPYWQCLFITLTAYLFQALFNNSTLGVAPIFWAFLGVCCRGSDGTPIHNNCRALGDKPQS